MPKRDQSCGACRQGQTLFPFTMAFQPIVDVQEKRIDTHEALVRGLNGESAASVLAQLTTDNLYAFDQACRVKAIEMAVQLGMDCRLSINFLPKAVYEPRACIRLTLDAAARTGFPLDRLTFEFTENEEIADTGHVLAIIAEYRRHGFMIALDDFATGFSGLARLADLRPDIIKLDRALVANCDRDTMRQAIVASLTELTDGAGIKLVAEGAERIEEVNALREAGVRFMQGFYFSPPVFEGLAAVSAIDWP